MKVKLLSAVNVFMAMFCAGSAFLNRCNVSVLNENKAITSFNGDSYEFSSLDNSFSISQNGKLIGTINTNHKFKFRPCKNNLPSLQCNGVFVLGKMAVAGVGAAAAGAGGAGAMAAAGAAGAGAGQVIGGAAVAAGGAAADVGLGLVAEIATVGAGGILLTVGAVALGGAALA